MRVGLTAPARLGGFAGIQVRLGLRWSREDAL
jgi:hypothetical protein